MKTPRGEISDSIVSLAHDDVLLEKMSKCKSPEEVYALVKDRVNMPFKQFAAEMDIARSCLKDMDAGLLTEADLDVIAGGEAADSMTNKIALENLINVAALYPWV